MAARRERERGGEGMEGEDKREGELRGKQDTGKGEKRKERKG